MCNDGELMFFDRAVVGGATRTWLAICLARGRSPQARAPLRHDRRGVGGDVPYRSAYATTCVGFGFGVRCSDPILEEARGHVVMDASFVLVKKDACGSRAEEGWPQYNGEDMLGCIFLSSP